MENEKKPSKVGAIFYGLLVIFIYLVIVSVAQLFGLVPIIMSIVSETAGDMTNFQELYLQKISENVGLISTTTFIGTVLAVITVVLWYYFGVYKKSVKQGTYESVLPTLKSAKSILFLICGAITGFSVAALVELMAMTIMPQIGDAFTTTMNAVIGGTDVLGYILTWVLAPIGEEVCLRGLVQNRAQKSFGLIGCMIISGIYFGIYHLNPIQGLYAIPIGLFLGFVAYKFNSVIPCILVHFLNNLIARFSTTLKFTNWIVPTVCAIVFGALMIYIGLQLFPRAKSQESAE